MGRIFRPTSIVRDASGQVIFDDHGKPKRRARTKNWFIRYYDANGKQHDESTGSTKIGENCMLAGQVGIAGHLTIANYTGIGAQSGISKSITEEGLKLMGSPSVEVGSFYKSYAVFKKLPDILYRLKELENKIQATQNESMPRD